MAGLYMAQSDWSKAKPYFFRARPDDNMVLVPLWEMCDLYDHWGSRKSRSLAGTG